MDNETLPKISTGDEQHHEIDGFYVDYVDEHEEPKKPPETNIIQEGLFSWYSTQMDSHPVLTKSVTGGCSTLVGDLLAQCIEYNYELIRLEEEPERFHVRRVIAMFMTGLAYGPLLHYVYEFYEHVLPIDYDKILVYGCRESIIESDTVLTADSPIHDKPSSRFNESIQNQYSCTMFYSSYSISQRKYMNAFLHVAIDQGIMGFIYVAIMMVVTGIVEGQWKELREEFHDDYIDNVHALWIAALIGIGPMQLLAFRFISLKWRCMAVNVLDVFEVMVMSSITHRNRELD